MTEGYSETAKEIKEKLKKADKADEETSNRLSHEEVFGEIRERLE